jgi:hypothetical protein
MIPHPVSCAPLFTKVKRGNFKHMEMVFLGLQEVKTQKQLSKFGFEQGCLIRTKIKRLSRTSKFNSNNLKNRKTCPARCQVKPQKERMRKGFLFQEEENL